MSEAASKVKKMRMMQAGMIFKVLFLWVGFLAAGHEVLAFSSAAPGSKVWIVRPDGAQSCGIKSGQSVEEVSEELKKAGVLVHEARKGSDGKMRMQVCGAPAGSVNAFLIEESDLPKAMAIGFKR
jgi:hypothetical protein